MKKPYQRCVSCVMDTTDSDISFDSRGVCDHCNTFFSKTVPSWKPFDHKYLSKLAKKIKSQSKNNDFDCIIGMSGGIDSSYLTYYASKILGLRPLVFHVDGGWNSDIAVGNIEKIVEKLKLDLYTHVIPWHEMRDLQLAFLKSGVSHIDTPQDHAFFATLYNFAAKHSIKYIFTGGNISTEGIRNPVNWMYYQSDSTQIKDIHRIFGEDDLSEFPFTNIIWHKIYLPYIRGIKVVRPLDYLYYSKDQAKDLLINEFGWTPYPQKHFESRFTRFYESYWLPKRFGYDVRKVQFSSLILTGQMSRSHALEELNSEPWDSTTIDDEINFVCKKLEIDRSYFDELLNSPLKYYSDYKSQSALYSFGSFLARFTGIFTGTKR